VALGAISELCYVLGAVLGVVSLMVVLAAAGGRGPADRGSGRLVIMAAAVTFVFANWLHQSFCPAARLPLLADPTANLFVPLVSAMFFASAAAAAVAALSLRIEPSRRRRLGGGPGIVDAGPAWQGWIGRFLSGSARHDRADGLHLPGRRADRRHTAESRGRLRQAVRAMNAIALGIADWLPMAAIVGCAFLDVMPRSRPLEVDPIAVGTCAWFCWPWHASASAWAGSA
jgi:hypothetical protein